MIGSTISHYNILEKLGEGGMGIVYKAQDTKLNRTVALKFLPEHISASEKDAARFMQEAQAAASLNHPNICTIHGIEESEDEHPSTGSTSLTGTSLGVKKHFIVMEFVDGQTLQERKSSLSMKQALDIGVQIAEGLAAAHEKGVVHRDIKPENIMIRKDGIAQIMDFGLAKLRGASRLTKEGSTVGTAGYMSPEQVQGQETDHRSDIFSLGVLLYEMLTSQLPFKGVHETAIAYEIVNVDSPPMSSLKHEISPELDVIVLECLEKDPKERTQSASQVAVDLKRYRRESSRSRVSRFTGTRPVQPGPSGVAQDPRSEEAPSFSRKALPLSRPLAAGLALMILFAGYGLSMLVGSEEPGTGIIRASIGTPPGVRYFDALGGHSAISPDGSMIVFGGVDSADNTLLWIRRLDNEEARVLVNTENAIYPFWSPDGKSIGYFSEGKLKTISSAGGPVLTLADAPFGRGATWSSNGTIVFCPALQDPNLYAVSASGGPTRVVASFDSSGRFYPRFPSFLPDGEHFLFAMVSVGVANQSNVFVASLNGDETAKILDDASNPLYSKGTLLFYRQGIIMGQPFDPESRSLSGKPVSLQGNVNAWAPRAKSDFSSSTNGILLYARGAGTSGQGTDFVWIDQAGQMKSILQTVVFSEPSLSPDQDQIAFDQPNRESSGIDIWTYDLRKNVQRRLTFLAPSAVLGPVWSRDGTKIYFNTELGGGKASVYVKRADGSGEHQILAKGDKTVTAGYYPTDVSPDGRYLLVAIANESISNLAILDLTGTTTPLPLKELGLQGSGAKFSPDGQWIVYRSNTRRSGTGRIMVSRFLGPTGTWEVAPEGGNPIWTANGIIFFSTRQSRHTKVDISFSGGSPAFSPPRSLFPGSVGSNVFIYGYSSTRKSYLGIRALSAGSNSRLSLIVHWPQLMK